MRGEGFVCAAETSPRVGLLGLFFGVGLHSLSSVAHKSWQIRSRPWEVLRVRDAADL